MSLLTKEIEKAYKDESSIVLFEDSNYRIVLYTGRNCLYVEVSSQDRMGAIRWNKVEPNTENSLLKQFILKNLKRTVRQEKLFANIQTTIDQTTTDIQKMNVKNMLHAYSKASSDLYKYFECPYTYVDISDHTNDDWCYNSFEVFWGEADEPEPCYVQELKQAYPKDDFTMIVYHTSTGDGLAILIFDNKKKTKWPKE